MRDDLLDAQACVDWTVAQLPAFAERIETWLGENVEAGIEKTEPPITHSPDNSGHERPSPARVQCRGRGLYQHHPKQPDILAMALVLRDGVGKPDEAYFPVLRSAAEFDAGRSKGSKFVKRLPERERAIIEALKPYQGGNDPLFALHQLDIMRKHRRLLAVRVEPAFTISDTTGRGLRIQDFVLYGVATLSPNEKSVLGFISNRAPGYNIEFAPKIALDESFPAVPPEIIGALRQFANLADAIIKLFD